MEEDTVRDEQLLSFREEAESLLAIANSGR
jgi:hypothetical protein